MKLKNAKASRKKTADNAALIIVCFFVIVNYQSINNKVIK